jgi:hypothetical protein
MKTRRLLAKIFSITGTALVLGPILFMLFTCVVGSIQSGSFRCDYMLPAELGIFVLIGMALLLTAAILVKMFIKPIAWTIVAIILLLVCGQLLAMASGLATAQVEPEEAPIGMAIIIGSLIAFDAAVTLLGVFGCMFICKLFRSKE